MEENRAGKTDWEMQGAGKHRWEDDIWTKTQG